MATKNKRPSDFYFSPSGKVHQLHRERLIVILGGQRALLLQVANPLVGQGVLDHSSVRNKPIERLNRTLSLMQSFVFGTNEEVAQITEKINHAHTFVNGKLPKSVGKHAAGTSYNAFDPELLMWVWATLTDTTVLVYETFIAPLTDADKESYYQECKGLLLPLGGDLAITPTSFTDLRAYMDAKYKNNEVMVSKAVKEEVIPYLLLQKPKRLKLPLLPFSMPLVKITVGLLPEELRKQYGLPWSKADQKLFNYFAAASRRVHGTSLAKLIPANVRFSAHYRRALHASER